MAPTKLRGKHSPSRHLWTGADGRDTTETLLNHARR